MSDPARVAQGRIGGHVTASRLDMREVAARARRGLRARFEREVDPDLILSEEERARRADHAIAAYYGRLSLKAAEARRRKTRKHADATEGKSAASAQATEDHGHGQPPR